MIFDRSTRVPADKGVSAVVLELLRDAYPPPSDVSPALQALIDELERKEATVNNRCAR